MNIADQQTSCDAISCIDAAADIITTDGLAGRAGFTASAAYNTTDTSPTLLVCLNRGTSVWLVFNENRTLCVSTLSAGQESLLNLFDGKTSMEHHFVAARWRTSVAGCPQLEKALILFDCRISQVVSVGIHDISFYAIEAIYRRATPYGLAWFDHSYHAPIRPACQPP